MEIFLLICIPKAKIIKTQLNNIIVKIQLLMFLFLLYSILQHEMYIMWANKQINTKHTLDTFFPGILDLNLRATLFNNIAQTEHLSYQEKYKWPRKRHFGIIINWSIVTKESLRDIISLTNSSIIYDENPRKTLQ